MRSLRAQLVTAIGLGTSAVLIVSGVGAYFVLSHVLRAEFDAALVAQSGALAALVEQDEDGVSFELHESSRPADSGESVAEWYQLWRSDGSVLARSAALRQRDLPLPADASERATFSDGTLPDGRRARRVTRVFLPRQEGSGDPAQPVTLAVARETASLDATLARVRDGLIVVGVVANGVSLLIAAWCVRRGLRPVRELGARIADIPGDDLSSRVDVPSIPAELSPVVSRLNELLARVQAAFERERRFTGDVAHELRTPLAGLRARLELALARQRSAGEYREALVLSLRIGVDMQRTAESLLQLARADANQLEVESEALNLCTLVRECWSALDDRVRERQLSVEWSLRDATVQSDRALLRLVIQNLLDNAVSHSDAKGRVRIAIEPGDGQAELEITNTGNTIPPEQLERVFDRFWRGNGDAGEGRHCGLGLPLCKAIIDRLGGRIGVSACGGEFCVRLTCPCGPAAASESEAGIGARSTGGG
ncbi:MAG: Adaptive-response sensory-kinase SasA [Phycisphaerae bacterium]|nr:Adaptive-response sensory-kinase SasA [Phycisphaerae bacterium]